MANFYVSLSDREIATQVVNLINKYNGWQSRFVAQAILLTPANYFVELQGSRVVGCAGHIKDYQTMSKIQHVCVLPEFRKCGIAQKLVNVAIEHCETEYVYVTIRADNTPSLKLFEKLGFRFATKHWFRDHWTYTLGRRKDVRYING